MRNRWRVIGVIGTAVLVGAGCAPTAPTDPSRAPSIEMAAGHVAGFFSLPWPNEVRKTTTGHLDVEGWPGVVWNPFAGDPLPTIPILPSLVYNLASAVDDFGTNSAIFLQATGELDPASFPTPSETLGVSSPVQVINLDTGERAPVIIEVQAGDRFRPNNLLTLLPYPGHPLRSNARYGVIITTGLRASSGLSLAPSPLLSELDGPWPGSGTQAEWAALRAQRDELRAVLADSTPFAAEALVAFTVFRTQDTNHDLQSVAAAVRGDHPSHTLAPQNSCGTPVVGWESSVLFSGELSLPQFQAGTYPFLTEGGTIVTASNGAAVVQGRQKVPLRVKVPCGTPPVGGWPILTFVDGTGGRANVENLPFNNTDGWVVASIPPMFGAGRPVPEEVVGFLRALGFPTAADQAELLFYNLLNPTAARSNPIQQAADHLSLQQAVEELSFTGAEVGSSVPVETNDTVKVISGQSQGAQTLPLVATADPEIDGVYSAAGSGGQYHTTAHKQSLRQGLGLFAATPEALDELNPLIQLVQTLNEGSDGINFSNTANYVNLAGYDDTCVPIETSRHFATTLGLQTVTQTEAASFYGDVHLDPPSTLALGVFGPGVNGRTRLNIEFPGGHFVAYENRPIGDQFLAGIKAGDAPRITVGTPGTSYGNCSERRYDNPPRRYAI